MHPAAALLAPKLNSPMKTLRKQLAFVATVLGWGTVALSAQSCAAPVHVSNAVVHSATASGEVASAAGESVLAVAKSASGVAAVPVHLSGKAVQASGHAIAASGEAAVAAGDGAARGGEKLWDFASGDPSARPKLDRERSVPPATKPAPPARGADPAPAEVMKSRL